MCKNGRCECSSGYSGERCQIGKYKFVILSSLKSSQLETYLYRCIITTNKYRLKYLNVYVLLFLEHTCELALETGPCLHELRQEMEKGKAEERSAGCCNYLKEILSNCQSRRAAYTQTECEKQCGKLIIVLAKKSLHRVSSFDSAFYKQNDRQNFQTI